MIEHFLEPQSFGKRVKVFIQLCPKSRFKIINIEDKIPDVTNLATNTSPNAKIDDVTGEILSIINLATTTALTAVESKIPNVRNLVKTQTIRQKLIKLKKKLLIETMINILLLQNLIS